MILQTRHENERRNTQNDQIQFTYPGFHGHNRSSITYVLILGFPSLNAHKMLFFAVVLFLYFMTITENVLITVLVSISHRLRSPMYFFLAHLAMTDIILVTNIVPNMLHIIIREGTTMSFSGCLTQFFMHGLAVSTECFLLTVMSGDRYLAICKPLHYMLFMTKSRQYSMVICCWMWSFMAALFTLVLACNLDFCGPHVIDHFFCDFFPVLALSCSETSMLEMDILLLSVPMMLVPFIFITGTYIHISLTIVRIPSLSGRRKAFSTCSAHIVAVCMYYGSMVSIYMIPYRAHSLLSNKLISLVYSLFTPLVNPVIYSLGNQEIKTSLVNMKCCHNTP